MMDWPLAANYKIAFLLHIVQEFTFGFEWDSGVNFFLKRMYNHTLEFKTETKCSTFGYSFQVQH